MATGAVVTAEASAQTGLVVAETTSGTVASFVGTLSSHDVGVGGTFTEGAVWSTGPDVAEATLVFDLVPWGAVGFGSFGSQLRLRDTGSASGAVVRADGALASIASVSRPALA